MLYESELDCKILSYPIILLVIFAFIYLWWGFWIMYFSYTECVQITHKQENSLGRTSD